MDFGLCRCQFGQDTSETQRILAESRPQPVSESPFGTDNTLSDSRFRNEKCPSDFLSRQASEQAKRERNASLGREHRMARDKNKAEKIVADFIIQTRREIRHRHLPDRDLAAKFLVLALEQLVATKTVDSPILGGSHKPGARVVRDARLRPLFKCDDERVLREVFSHTEVAHHPCQTSDE